MILCDRIKIYLKAPKGLTFFIILSFPSFAMADVIEILSLGTTSNNRAIWQVTNNSSSSKAVIELNSMQAGASGVRLDFDALPGVTVLETDPLISGWYWQVAEGGTLQTSGDVLELPTVNSTIIDLSMANNAVGISTNASDITANTTAIEGNDTDIAANTTAIEGNNTDISTNLDYISINGAAIVGNDSDIAANTTAIEGNDTEISTNTTAI